MSNVDPDVVISLLKKLIVDLITQLVDFTKQIEGMKNGSSLPIDSALQAKKDAKKKLFREETKQTEISL